MIPYLTTWTPQSLIELRGFIELDTKRCEACKGTGDTCPGSVPGDPCPMHPCKVCERRRVVAAFDDCGRTVECDACLGSGGSATGYGPCPYKGKGCEKGKRIVRPGEFIQGATDGDLLRAPAAGG